MEPGDIVQITDIKHPWFPSLLIVSEEKGWGVQAVCFIPQSNKINEVGHAYNRLKHEQIIKVGRAIVTPDW
jgi:hypothetical protein